MSKRRSPWSSNCPLQMKSHIGLREVAYGVNGLSYRNNIHERTKRLMLEGAKEFYSKPRTLEDIENIEIDFPEPINMLNNDHQASILSFFNKTSVKSKPLVYLKENQAETGPTRYPRVPDVGSRCSSCSESVRPDCECPCAVCDEFFCSNCSQISYGTSHSTSTCVSCSKT